MQKYQRTSGKTGARWYFAKVGVEGSIPFARSNIPFEFQRVGFSHDLEQKKHQLVLKKILENANIS